MLEPIGISLDDFLKELAAHPEKGNPVVVRITNKRSVPLNMQMEPLGDEWKPLQPGTACDVVAQTPSGDYALDIDIEESGIRVWFISPTLAYGKSFNVDTSVTD